MSDVIVDNPLRSHQLVSERSTLLTPIETLPSQQKPCRTFSGEVPIPIKGDVSSKEWCKRWQLASLATDLKALFKLWWIPLHRYVADPRETNQFSDLFDSQSYPDSWLCLVTRFTHLALARDGAVRTLGRIRIQWYRRSKINVFNEFAENHLKDLGVQFVFLFEREHWENPPNASDTCWEGCPKFRRLE